jgi:hypothetical protein
VASMGDTTCTQRVLVGKHEGKRPLGRPRRSWEDNIKRELQEVEWGKHGPNFCGSGQMLACCECGNEPSVPVELIQVNVSLTVHAQQLPS